MQTVLDVFTEIWEKGCASRVKWAEKNSTNGDVLGKVIRTAQKRGGKPSRRDSK